MFEQFIASITFVIS